MPVPTRRRRVWPWILFGLLAVLLAVAAAAGALTMQFWSEAQRARAAVGRAAAGIAELRGSLDSIDEAQLLAATDEIQANVTLAVRTVDGPLWDLASRVPFIGQNVDAVRRVTHAVDVLAERALTPGLQFLSATDFDDLALDGGGIDLEPFRQVQSSIPEIAAAFADAQSIVAPIDTARLLPEVSESIADILTFIDLATPALGVAEKYLPTLLAMAGSDGTRTYLLIFQNNAEIRATGGNPAASMIVTLTDGKLGYVDQASSQTFYDVGTQDDVYVVLPAETTGLYLPTFAMHSQDYTFTPDFPTTAQLFQALWVHTTGATFDGVVSIDPVVLSYMLAVAGPVTIGTGEQLTADNAVSVLLRDAYERYPESRDSDRFFADAAKQVFSHLTTSTWDPLQMLEALKKGAAEQRVNLAFVDQAAQGLAVELGVDGALAGDTTTQTQVGIYLNDSSVGKLEYHLTTSIIATCDAAARTITTTMTMTNGIGDDIRSPYTLGLRNWQFGLPRTTMILDVLFFAPPGGQITHTVPAKGDVARWERSGVEKGNPAVSKTVFVGKGETVTTAFTVTLPPGDLGPLRLRHSPTATATSVTIDPGCAVLFPAAP